MAFRATPSTIPASTLSALFQDNQVFYPSPHFPTMEALPVFPSLLGVENRTKHVLLQTSVPAPILSTPFKVCPSTILPRNS